MRPRIYRNRRCVKWPEEALDLPRGRDRIASKENKVMGRYNRFKESFGDMARDLAKFLTRLARGEAPKGKD